MRFRRYFSLEVQTKIGKTIRLLEEEFPKIVKPKIEFNRSIYSDDLFFKAELVKSIPPVAIQGIDNYFRFLKISRCFISMYLKNRNLEIVKMESISEKNMMLHWRITGQSRSLFFNTKYQSYEGYSILHFNEQGKVHRHSVNNIIPPPKITQTMKALIWWWKYRAGSQSIQLN